MNSSAAYLGRPVTIVIDRQLGSRHPRWGFVYPLNYGYVPETVAADGEPLDAYLLGVFTPVTEYTGTCIAMIRRLHDDDDKLIVVPALQTYNDDQIRALTEFQERFFHSVILRSKPNDT